MSKTQGAALPTRISLSSEFYDVKEVERLIDHTGILSGEIDYNQSQISLEKSIGAQIKARILIHECVHYFFHAYGHKEAIRPDAFEDIVTMLSTAITALIRRNPDLVKYIQELPE